MRISLLSASMLIGIVISGCGDDSGPGGPDAGNLNHNQSAAICGNGEIEENEQCDDGADNSDIAPDACRTDCTSHRCGDGVVDSGEPCDEGPANSDIAPDACRTDCTRPRCGDRVVDVNQGELCDCGDDPDALPDRCTAVNGDPDGTCGLACLPLYCGNGQIDASRGEECDDGGFEPGDGCGPTCLLEECGNGFLDPDEACDDGNLTAGDGCSPDCLVEQCGNGVRDPDEECDDGNLTAGDGCSPLCVLEECGNGILDPEEECDDGGTDEGDGCGSTCLIERCGNGVVESGLGEECDDGGFDPGDGCGPMCLREECGNGFPDPGEECDLGAANSLSPNALCRPDCHPRRCLDGVVDPLAGEQCEPGQPLGRTCQDFGFYSPEGLGCTDLCSFSTAACTGYCGDGVIDPGEFCDGLPPPGEGCAAYGKDMGGIICSQACAPRFDRCVDFGWVGVNRCVSYPLSGAWAGPGPIHAGNPLYAVGTNWGSSVLLRWDGNCEQHITGIGLRAVWGSGAPAPSTPLHLVGDDGVTMTWDGAAFATLANPYSGNAARDLRSVWGSGPTDVYAVGTSGGAAATILRYDGSVWTAMTAPVTNDLHAVWGSGVPSPARPLIAVGAGGRILSYDGTAWTTMANPDPGLSTLRAVTGTGAPGPSMPVFAAGHAGILLRYDGTTWTVVTTPIAGTGTAITGLSVTGSPSPASPLFAVTDAGTVLVYDGFTWRTATTETTDALAAIRSNGPGEALAVGAAGRMERFSGATLLDLSNPTTTSYTFGIYASGDPSPSSPLFIVGGMYPAGSGRISKFDGTTWTEMNHGATSFVNAVWGSGPPDATHKVYAGGRGGYFRSYDGNGSNTWTAVGGLPAAYAGYVWISLWGSGPPRPGSPLFVVGRNHPDSPTAGVVLSFDGTTWKTELSGALTGTFTPTMITGSGPPSPEHPVFLAGGYAAMRYDGTTWTYDTELDASSNDGWFRAAWTSGADDVFMIGNGGSIFHYDGNAWSQQLSGASQHLLVITGTGRNDVFIGADAGLLLHYDGYTWSPVRIAAIDVQSLAVSGSHLYLGQRSTQSKLERLGLGICASWTPIGCDELRVDDSLAGKLELDHHACAGRPEFGPERYYRLVSPVTGSVTVTLSPTSADLDLVVLGADPTGFCEPSECLGASTVGGQADDSVTFAAVAGETYYLVVEGPTMDSGGFTLEVACP